MTLSVHHAFRASGHVVIKKRLFLVEFYTVTSCLRYLLEYPLDPPNPPTKKKEKTSTVDRKKVGVECAKDCLPAEKMEQMNKILSMFREGKQKRLPSM